MYLFLQGPPRVGKSTIIRNALLPYREKVAGLMTQRLFQDGNICGFRACAIGGGTLPELEGEYRAGMDGVFLYKGTSFPGVLESAIARARDLCAGNGCGLILLDEIGGIELMSPAFMEPLNEILNLGKPLIGSVKSHENLTNTARMLRLKDDILRESEKLHQRLLQNGKVLSVTEDNLGQTAKEVEEFILRVWRG